MILNKIKIHNMYRIYILNPASILIFIFQPANHVRPTSGGKIGFFLTYTKDINSLLLLISIVLIEIMLHGEPFQPSLFHFPFD